MGNKLRRRQFLQRSLAATAAALSAPYLSCGKTGVATPMTRELGRTGLKVTTLGLGGQASLQWTPADVDPAAIIAKAYNLGITYFDTSNVYGPSQENYGRAFRELKLAPGLPGYEERRRRSIHLASKTMVRYAKGLNPEVPDRTQGPEGSKSVDDLKRTLSLVFGDGKGAYPDEAYVDLMFIHNLNSLAEVDAIYEGLSDTDPAAERIGTLAALRDWRDGTNLTGLNPGEEKRIRHIGISGHFSSPVMMECLQRDDSDIIDAMLIAINANDKNYLNHQFNAIPVAAAKNVGIVAMKVFADGAMYTKPAKWSRTPEDVVRTVGDSEIPSRPLVEYALATPGIGTAIIGIGQIDNDPARCQLEQNLSSAQIKPNSLGSGDREEIESSALRAKGGDTNWFQVPKQPLGAPRDVVAEVISQDGQRSVRVTWQTAYASDSPVQFYEILRDGQPVGRVDHSPQLTREPFQFESKADSDERSAFQVVTVDGKGRRTPSAELRPS